MNPTLRLLALCSFMLVAFVCQAQQAQYRLFIYNRLHNSFEAVVANKPYAVVVNDTATFKGYFDAVYENNFLFVTKDSVYVLHPNEIKSVMRIKGFSDSGAPLSFGEHIGEYTCIGISAFSTFILLPVSLALLSDELTAGLFLGAVSAVLAVGPALIASALINKGEASAEAINSRPGERFNDLEVCIRASAP